MVTEPTALKRNAILTILNQSLAIAEKDLAQEFRFRYQYIANILTLSLINFGLFATVYHGFTASTSSSSPLLGANNYVSFVVLGALASTIFTFGINAFSTRLLSEKYWETARGLLASPLKPVSLLLGVGLAELVRFIIISIVLFAVAFAFNPVGIYTLMGVIGILLLLFVSVLGLGLVRGVFTLTNENIDPLFTYLMIGTAYLSAFYYPVSYIPAFLQPLATINPVNYAVLSIRDLWNGQLPGPFLIAVVIITALASVSAATYLFNKIWRAMDIAGY